MPTIIRGSDRRFRIHLKKTSGEPLDLTSCTAIMSLFKDEDDVVRVRSFVDGEMVFVNRGGGIVDVQLDKEFTKTLKIGERQEFQLEAVVGTETIIVSFADALTILPRLEDN